MKASVESAYTTPKFEPRKLEIIIESVEELNELIARFNTAMSNLAWSKCPQQNTSHFGDVWCLLTDIKNNIDGSGNGT